MVCYICGEPASACCYTCRRYMCIAHTCYDWHKNIACRECYPKEVEKINEAGRIASMKEQREDYERRKRRFFLW